MIDKLQIPLLIALDDRLANGRGMSNCYLVGIAGDCGLDCPVLLAGECESEDEMLESKTRADRPARLSSQQF